ncbi:UDP-glucuronosyltransferase-like [Orussus abietinus]|uniref:UDP-glucuronosyltransferase-like n=1 Tax=Orussus abietinus TaxID=222816 RepID=UPI000626491A|nr:UDP-glucuronosyltransferase-like [Orussus abietinus]
MSPRLMFLLLMISIDVSVSYRILCIFPLHMKSHQTMFGGLIRGLVKRGHHVDEISHYPQKSSLENYRHVVNLDGTLPKLVNGISLEYANNISSDIIEFIAGTNGNKVCELLALDTMQKFIKDLPNGEPYDLVITEGFGANCYMGFGKFLKVPTVVMVSLNGLPWIDSNVGNPASTAFYPNTFMRGSAPLNFWDRLTNTLNNVILKYRFERYTARQTEIMRRYISPDLPDIRVVEKDVALVLTNSHYTTNGIRPNTPAYVEVGGLHVESDDAEISEDLSKWMNESKDGVVYFTLGSMAKIETMPREKILAFYASFAKIAPVKVLMKIWDESLLPPGLPKNVRISSWIPQVPVLAHKNTKAFITHCGLMGTQEALYHGVPMIGLPLFGDQHRNVRAYMAKNVLIMLPHEDVTSESMDAALKAILRDPKYREAAKFESARFRDRPMTATNTAIFWIEYVVRNGANSLRSLSLDLHWWQIALLDVYGFLALCTILTCYIILLSLRIAIRICRAGTTRPDARKKLN